MDDIVNMPREVDPIEFHNFALRLPKGVHKIIEEMSWENRTSVNIQIIDLLIFALYKLNQTVFDATFDSSGSVTITSDEETGEQITHVGKDEMQSMKAIFKKSEIALESLTKKDVSEVMSIFDDIFVEYPTWRSKK